MTGIGRDAGKPIDSPACSLRRRTPASTRAGPDNGGLFDLAVQPNQRFQWARFRLGGYVESDISSMGTQHRTGAFHPCVNLEQAH